MGQNGDLPRDVNGQVIAYKNSDIYIVFLVLMRTLPEAQSPVHCTQIDTESNLSII